MTVKNTPHLYEIPSITSLTMNNYKMLKMSKTAIILLSLMEGKSRKFLFGSGASLQDGGGNKKKNSDFSMCSHPAASIMSSSNRQRLSHLFLWTQKELAAVDWKGLCPANFCWLLPKAHSGCCVVVAEGRWLISLQQHQAAQNTANPAAFPLLLPLSWQNRLKLLHPQLLGFIYLAIPGLAATPAHRKEGKASAEGCPA